MRAFLAAGLVATLGFFACGGCASTKMPSLPTFGFKGKNNKSSAAQLTNAPPAPQLNAMAGGNGGPAPQPSSSWSSLPVYPGTTYQQTPYPDQAPAGQQPGYANYPQAQGGPAGPQDPAASGYAPSYGAMPPSVANNAAPYPATAGGEASAYAGQQAGAYAPQQAAPYGAQQAAPNAAQQAPPYAQQPPQGAPQQAPYGQQQTPYAQQAAPYGQQGDPHNAANPYGSYTR